MVKVTRDGDKKKKGDEHAAVWPSRSAMIKIITIEL